MMSNISENLSDDEIFTRFSLNKPDFKEATENWDRHFKESFCRLVRAVHNAGLDWWHVNIDGQIRFGRKEPGAKRAAKKDVLVVIEAKIKKIRSANEGTTKVGEFGAIPESTLDIDVMDRLSKFFEDQRTKAMPPLDPRDEFKAYWPDEIGIYRKGVAKA